MLMRTDGICDYRQSDDGLWRKELKVNDTVKKNGTIAEPEIGAVKESFDITEEQLTELCRLSSYSDSPWLRTMSPYTIAIAGEGFIMNVEQDFKLKGDIHKSILFYKQPFTLNVHTKGHSYLGTLWKGKDINHESKWKVPAIEFEDGNDYDYSLFGTPNPAKFENSKLIERLKNTKGKFYTNGKHWKFENEKGEFVIGKCKD